MLLRSMYWVKRSEHLAEESKIYNNLFYWIFHVFAGLFNKIIENAHRESLKTDSFMNSISTATNNKPGHSNEQNVIAQDIAYLGKILNEKSKCFDISAFIYFIQKMNEVLKKNEIEVLNHEAEMLSLFVDIQNISNISVECKEITLSNIQFLYGQINRRPFQIPVFPNKNSTEIDTFLKLMNSKTNNESSNSSKKFAKEPANTTGNPTENSDSKEQYYILSGKSEKSINLVNYIMLQQNNYYTINSNESSTAKTNNEANDNYFDNKQNDESEIKTEKMTRKDVERYLGKKVAKSSMKRLSSSNVHQKVSTKTLQNMIEIQFEDDPSISLAPVAEPQSSKKEKEPTPKLKKCNKSKLKPKHKSSLNKCIRPIKQESVKILTGSNQKDQRGGASHFRLDRKYQELVDLVENPRKHVSNLSKDAKAYLEKAKLLKEELNEFRNIYQDELNECLKDSSHVFMKNQFPTMYNTENFYENIYLLKKRRENIKNHVCDVKLVNEGKSMSSNNLEILLSGNKINSCSQNIVNIKTMRKIWDPKNTDVNRIQDLLFNIEKKFPIEEFRWTQEVVLELLMKQNYDDEKLLNMLDELNFKQAIEERASQLTDTIPLDDTVTKRLSLRRSTQTQQHAGINLYLKTKN